MDAPQQTRQVFVDDSGRRHRLVTLALRVGSVITVAYLGLLVAGFLGASWVPSVRLPVIGDIFDVAHDDLVERGQVAEGEADAEASTVAHPVTNHSRGPDSEALAAQGDPATEGETSGRATGRGSPRGAGRGGAPLVRPTPRATPNHGASSGNPNAGPKPKKTPAPASSPNRGSSGNSENAGPKPKPTKGPDHPSNNGKGNQAEPSPSPSPTA